MRQQQILLALSMLFTNHAFGQEQNTFQKARIAELLTKYPDVFYIWNDALDDSIMSADEILAHIRGTSPNTIASANWWDWD